MGPLTGYKIIDLTTEDNTAIASSILCELGAEIIKIQPKEYIPTESKISYRNILNLGTKSVNLDIFTEEGSMLYKKLISKVHGVICNYSNEKLKEFSIDFDSLKEINPSLTFLSTSSYGNIGETEEDDILALADSGLLYFTGDEGGVPITPGYNAGSHWTGLLSVFAICGGLLKGKVHKKATKLNLSIRDALFFMTEIGVFEYTVFEKDHARNGNHDTGVSPYGLFKTSDGYMALSTVSEKAWKEVAMAIGREYLIEDPRFINSELRVLNTLDLVKEIEGFTQTMTKFENQKYFLEKGISCGPVLTPLEAMENEQLKARNMIITTELDKTLKLIATPMKFSETIPNKNFSSFEFGKNTSEFLG